MLQSLEYRRSDGTFVGTVNGGPYHIIPGEQYWQQALAMSEVKMPPLEPDPEPQPEPIPQSISRFQARAALLATGLLSDVEAAVAAADPFAQLAWAEAQEWRRDSPTLLALAHGIGLTDAEIDDLFVQAAAIRA